MALIPAVAVTDSENSRTAADLTKAIRAAQPSTIRPDCINNKFVILLLLFCVVIFIDILYNIRVYN